MHARGFCIVRDGGTGSPRAVYLYPDHSWRHDGSGARIFASSIHARQWIETRPRAYWLIDPAGPPRVISARAAGVTAV